MFGPFSHSLLFYDIDIEIQRVIQSLFAVHLGKYTQLTAKSLGLFLPIPLAGLAGCS